MVMAEERVRELTRLQMPGTYVSAQQQPDPLVFLVLLPFLPLYFFYLAFSSMQAQQPKMKITQVFRDELGRIKEISTYYE